MIAHLLAAPSGMSFDPDLNRDYWFWGGEPWDIEQEISWRFLKIVYLYLAAAIVQIGAPSYLIIAIGQLFRKGGAGLIFSPVLWAIFAVLMCIAVLVGLLLAFFEWRKIICHRKLIVK